MKKGSAARVSRETKLCGRRAKSISSGGDAGVGDTDNVGGVVCVVAESRRCAAELLLDASENIFDRGSGS